MTLSHSNRMPAEFAGVTILVVEDDEDLLESETRILERAGFCVLASASAEAALDIFRASNVDIILTDLRLPGMSGLELIKVIRELRPDAKIMVVTAYSDDEVVQTVIDMGQTCLLTKPMLKEDLFRALRGLLNGQLP